MGCGSSSPRTKAGTTCEDYGVWVEKSMYGKTYMGIERATVLIDGDGQGGAGLAQGQRQGPCRRGAGGGKAL